MGQKQPGQGTARELFGAISDFFILILMLAAAGFGGYFWGHNERLAPVQNVPPGTPGALPPAVVMPAPQEQPAAKQPQPTQSTSSTAKPDSQPAKARPKYWISSSGTDYMGYSVTVKVNDNPVDSFFGPGKSVDISRFVKAGDNTIAFEAKSLGEQYNKHPGDANSTLTLQLVTGLFLQEHFKPADVLVTYKRTAAESQDFNDTMHFAGE